MAETCLVVLCGLPGAGKSTLSRLLRDESESLFTAVITALARSALHSSALELYYIHQDCPKVWHVCYDDVENTIGGGGNEAFSTDIWQQSRRKAHDDVERLLNQANDEAR
jgi:predicted kinase